MVCGKYCLLLLFVCPFCAELIASDSHLVPLKKKIKKSHYENTVFKMCLHNDNDDYQIVSTEKRLFFFYFLISSVHSAYNKRSKNSVLLRCPYIRHCRRIFYDRRSISEVFDSQCAGKTGRVSLETKRKKTPGE